LLGNDFPLHADTRAALLIAGGIGICVSRSHSAALTLDL